ncbi:hypothetical protein L2E82_45504 [Cichorium intybus]|uniref:Uncharacterized protein n=1 Tax=Cichorium intybus TaxID=13427 RepID=A0ACB8ZUH8_CICIN|nr:hypothetical protein L2E82_45504 [Cichorium intybus]
MGVPSFYRWLANKYPKIVVNAVEKSEEEDGTLPNPNGREFDNLYLDMNGIIHPCFHPEHDDVLSKHACFFIFFLFQYSLNTPGTYEEVFNNIFDYIDRIMMIVRPRKLLYLAIDGVAPRAKMNQQRTRRFRTAKDQENLRKEEDRLRRQYEIEGRDVLPNQESEVSDSNIITPGTKFMFELSSRLQDYINMRISKNLAWKHLKVILSDANAPGEGEHKIMSFIRLQRTCSGYNPNTSHVLYGLFDLIGGLKDTSEQMNNLEISTLSKKELVKKPHQFLHVWILREYLNIDLRTENVPEKFIYDIERLIDDFVFICFFAGNDFLPHMPTLEIHEGAIDLLIHVYKQEFKNLGGYLVNTEKVDDKKGGNIKLKRVEKFILAVGAYEEQIFKKRSAIRDSKLRRMLSDIEDNSGNGEEELFPVIRSTHNLKDSSIGSGGKLSDNEIFENTKALKEQMKSYTREISDVFRNGLVSDTVKLGTPGWRNRYYQYKFSSETETDMENMRKKVVEKYTEGVCWVLLYYFSGVPSWTWFYPYHYGPFASDFKGLSSIKLILQRGSPFKPFDQLMAVLPPTSAHALPPSYQSLMTADHSSILDFYPDDFDVDMDGKRFLWQGICKLPFIEEERLLAETKKIEKELNEEEAKRNTANADKLFVNGSENLALRITSAFSDAGSIERKSSIKIDTDLSGDINGFVHPNRDPENVGDSGGRADDHDVLCVYYDTPCFSLHIPRVLEGTVIPELVVSESDIEEGHLWHESHGYPSRSNRSHGQKVEEIRPSVGYASGWSGRGRGRGHNAALNSQSGIEERHLWHENLSYPNPKNRSYEQVPAIRFPSIRAGSGWSPRGRGRAQNAGLSSRSSSLHDATMRPNGQMNSASWWNTNGRGAQRNGNGENRSTSYNSRTNNVHGQTLSVRSGYGSNSNEARGRWGDTQSKNASLDATNGRWQRY